MVVSVLLSAGDKREGNSDAVDVRSPEHEILGILPSLPPNQRRFYLCSGVRGCPTSETPSEFCQRGDRS
jgi:hypothetical protein